MWPASRRHEGRLDDGYDVFAAGVLRAQGGALVGVETAGEERAHDARLDELPVSLGRLGEQAALVVAEIEDGGILEQMAVEIPDFVFAEISAFGHDAEEPLQRFEIGRASCRERV